MSNNLDQLTDWLKEHKITEVECMISDLTGITRGKISPTNKFIAEKGMRLRGHFKGLRGDSEGAIADGLEAVKLAKSIGARTLHERAAATLAPLGDGVTL